MTALSVRPSEGRGSRSRRSKWLTIGLFVLPALTLYGLFVLLPIVQAAHYSLYKWNGLQPLTDFIGLKNYQVALASDAFARRSATTCSSPCCRWRSRSRSR